MRKRLNKNYFKTMIVGAVTVLASLAVLAGSSARAQDVTQGYLSGTPLQNGLIVRLQANSKNKVEPLSQEKENDMFGVVVSSSEAPVSLSDPSQNQVFVASFGQYQVLVNTQNGAIRAGDGVVVSSLTGVGMKADALHRLLVGKALESFKDDANAEGHARLSTGRSVALGRILVDISIKRNPAYTGDTVVGVPRALSRAAQAVTDRPITALRLYGGLAMLFVCMTVAGGIMYVGIHASLTSIGRNPLAKKSILRSMITIILSSLTVVSVGLFAVYLILRI